MANGAVSADIREREPLVACSARAGVASWKSRILSD
jgi:hypothetical protein